MPLGAASERYGYVPCCELGGLGIIDDVEGPGEMEERKEERGEAEECARRTGYASYEFVGAPPRLGGNGGLVAGPAGVFAQGGT